MNLSLLLIIFLINLVYIALNTVRNLLVMRGYRTVAPFIAMVEVTIYTLGLSMVMQYLDSPIYLIVYALGFGLGIYVGMLIEDRMALGYSTIQIVTKDTDHTLAQALRDLGYGVTIQVGYGRDGERLVLTVLTPRSSESTLYRTLDEISPEAFYYASEVKFIHGGFLSKRINTKVIEERFENVEEVSDFIHETDFTPKEEYVADDFQTAEDYEAEHVEEQEAKKADDL